MREQDLEFNPEYKYAKGGEIEKVVALTQDDGRPHLVYIDKIPPTEKGKKQYLKDGYYIDNQMGFKGLITSYFKSTKLLKENIAPKYHSQLDSQLEFIMAKGGKTKKFPVAVKRRIDEINEMLPKVNESGDYASTYAGSTMESYIILDKPIQIKGNYVYISEEDSRWGKYGFEKRYNVNDTRDVYESIKGRKALMSDLGIIKRAFTKLLKSEGKMAKGGIAKKSEYISNRDIVSLTHKKGGTKKTLKGSQLVDGAYAKKKIMRKKPTKSDQLSLLNKGGEIVRAYDVNINSGVGTYARGGITKNNQIIEQFLDEKTNNSLRNISIHYSTLGDVMLLRNYGTLIAKRKGKKVSISNKKYSSTTSTIQNAIERMAKERGMKVERISEDKFARGGKTYKDLSAKEKVELRKMQKAAIESYRKTQAGGKAKSSGKGYKNLSAKEKVEFRKMQEAAIKSYRKTQSKKMAVGGKTTMAGDTDFPSELLNYAKGGKFAAGGNVSYNGWTNYATWVTNLEILDGMDWKDYNMGEPISAEQVKDYVDEVMEQSPELALSFANRFLNDVNYYEIVEHINDEFDLDDGEKDEYAKGGKMKKPMIRYSGRR